MQNLLIRIIYHVGLIGSTVYFCLELYRRFVLHEIMNHHIVKSVAVMVMFIFSYITISDKAYMTGSIPLRFVMIVSGTVCLFCFMISISPT